jgi:REP element-mobilizing transposase RayT
MYFITICTEEKRKILSNFVCNENNVRDGVPDIPKNILTNYGKIVDKYINEINKLGKVNIIKYVIMPNHIHMIVEIDCEGGMSGTPSRTNETIPYIVSTLKRFVNKEIGENIFHRSYHDHIIRNEQDYQHIWNYIDNNPLKWELDCFYE